MSASRPAAVIVLAAGEGTRMKSRKVPKVLHELCGRSMVGHVLAAARDSIPDGSSSWSATAGTRSIEHLAEVEPDAVPVTQAEQNGTGHAVRMVLEAVGAIEGTVLVLNGDAPLLARRGPAQAARRSTSARATPRRS